MAVLCVPREKTQEERIMWVYTFERVDKPAGWPGGEVE